jgi:hypothetical protein
MDWMKNMAGRVWGLVPGTLNLVRNVLGGVWAEVRDGHHRLSWWLLLGAAALAGRCAPTVLGWL